MEMLLDAMAILPAPNPSQSQLGGSPETSQSIGNDGSQNHDIDAQPVHKQQGRDPQGRATHQCKLCHRSYERVDRLTRHLKTHENARRYQCQRCQKSFNRADLHNRHVMTHERNASSATGRADIRRTERACQACIPCATAKARCEDVKPCRRCRTKNITCEITMQKSYNSHVPLQGEAFSHASSTYSSSPRGLMVGPSVNPSTATQEVENAELQAHSLTMITESSEEANLCTAQLAGYGAPTHELAPPMSVEPLLAQSTIYGMNSMSADTAGLGLDNFMSELLFLPNATNFNNQNLEIDFHDFTFQDEQSEFSAAIPNQTHIDDAVRVDVPGKPSRSTRNIRAGYAAFTRSPWLWTPARKDYILRDGEDLALDEGSISSALSPRFSSLMPNVPSCGFPTIKSSMRDKMYYLVSTMNKYTNRIPEFPSLDIINHVIEAFFIRQSYQVDNWIHVPSTSVSEIIPEIFLGLVTAGSTVISVPAIWKMGLVLQDVLRVKIGEMWERENSSTRKLQPLQAWMLSLDTGLWSGFQRQMELAESFVQPLMTMMRRGGILGAPADTQALVPNELDTGQVLEAKWMRWAQRESFKRLCIHLFLHDTRASIALQKNPLISMTEIKSSLPASRILFLAGSASEWKMHYLEQRYRSTHASPQLIDVMRDISILDDLDTEVDVSLCYMAALHGFWGQIWGFQEAWRFHGIGENEDSPHRLWLVTQQRELYRQIDTFRQSLLGTQTPQAELMITAEVLLMILHVSPEELQRFAGKHGEEAAFLSYAGLERWSATEQSRRAIWHAGQILRWAYLMPPAELRDFYAIAVYFASLTLWAFGHLSSSSPKHTSQQSRGTDAISNPDTSSPFAILNCQECFESRAFITGRQVIPALMPVHAESSFTVIRSRDERPIRLDDSNAVLNVARDLYRNNFPVHEKPLPPLVENMSNLMRDLSSLPENRFSRCVSPAEQGSSSPE